ncbi:T9SS type A sorting domain-containing protein [Taibaiella koreensis]|uniref:T9SS type A sorting domain-containing protein n=1 Tax=Taibaiella koreensis TaxID=1268548 RepID=UPI000E59AC91|nr:peptide-N-glycosidase F-related protein [Taibaiella koreensis]
MKKIYILLCLCVAGLLPSVHAANGDTTIVQGHNDVIIQTDPSVGQTLYPAWSVFPPASTPYRKIYAHLSLKCPPNLNCGEWDYLNHIFIGKTGGMAGDSLGYELGRFITPYGNYWKTTATNNWEHGWWIDVTDWGYLLHDSVELIYKHTGYEAQNDRGWLINLQYYVIEGPAIRDFVRMDTLWNGSFRYGDAAAPIEDKLNARNLTLAPGTASARLWIMQSGHGSDDADQCGEFCAKNRMVKWDNQTVNTRLVWRECGFNSLYPQAGTWLLDRANWCPGAFVDPDWVEIGELTGGSNHSIDIDMEPYTATADFGNMFFTTYLFEYGAPHAQVDAGIERIIAPSTDLEQKRMNPICGQPIIKIRNNGARALTSLAIEYGLAGQAKATFQWTGNLAFGQSEIVTLTNAVQYLLQGDAVFEVTLKLPNGGTDEYTLDNSASSLIKKTDVQPHAFIVEFKNTKANQENSYKFIEAQTGQVVHQKGINDFPLATTLYRDTVVLAKNTCYILEFSDEGTPLAGGIDQNKDGLTFWFWDALAQQYPQYLQYLDNDDGSLQLKDYHSNASLLNFSGTYNQGKGAIQKADFGTKIVYQFSTSNETVSAGTVQQLNADIDVYPNPSPDGLFAISYHIPGNTGAQLEVQDIRGTVVLQAQLKGEGGVYALDLKSRARGMYTLKITSGKAATVRKLVTR